MTEKQMTAEQLEAKLSKKTIKLEASKCPVCGGQRSKGSHRKCSRITQQKYKPEQ